MNEPYQQFLALVGRDEQYRQISNSIQKQLKLIQDLQLKRESQKNQFSNTKSSLDHAQKELKNWEAELEVFAEREKILKKNLESLSNIRDIKAAQKELSLLAQEREMAEESLMDALNKVENLSKSSSETETKKSEMLLAIDKEIEAAQEQKDKLEKDLLEFQKEENIISENIPEQWLELYKRVRSRISDPIAYLINDSCNACGAVLTKHEVMTVRRLSVTSCGQCYRVLCYKG